MARRRGTAGPGTGGRLCLPPPGDPPFLGAAQRGDSGSTATRCIASGGVSRFLSSAFARGRCWWGYFYYFVWVFFFFFLFAAGGDIPRFSRLETCGGFPDRAHLVSAATAASRPHPRGRGSRPARCGTCPVALVSVLSVLPREHEGRRSVFLALLPRPADCGALNPRQFARPYRRWDAVSGGCCLRGAPFAPHFSHCRQPSVGCGPASPEPGPKLCRRMAQWAGSCRYRAAATANPGR